ncbi:MAG TPA: VWA domain-containing protein [Thermoanaerobaculia bacterium]|nr:VWA domain-containing protein [Thermoanaerobaculia bacterium]
MSIVNVDVFVTDRKGNRVHGLTKDDFVIRERGRVQPITNFAEYAPVGGESVQVQGAPATGAQAAAKPAPRSKRTIVLFIEWFSQPNFRTRPMFEAMREFVRRNVAPGDAVSIVTWANVADVRLEPTDDVAAMERVLSQIEAETSGVDVEKARVLYARYQDQMTRAWAGAGQSAAIERGLNARSSIDSTYWDLQELELFKIKQKANTLKSLMHSIAGVEGKKIVLMATHRFGTFAGHQFNPQFLGNSWYDTRHIRDSVTRTANANNITLYTVYPAGLGSSFEGADVTRDDIWRTSHMTDALKNAQENEILLNETTALAEIAEKTGGAMAWGHSDIVKLLPRIGDDLDSYYSLAYRTPSEGRDRATNIEVRTKNPNYVVRARKQYVEKSDTTRMNERVVAGLFRKTDGSVLPIEAKLGAVEKAGRGRWRVPVSVRIPVQNLTTHEDGDGVKGAFSVFVAAGGQFGVTSEVVQRTQPFTISATQLASTKSSHFTYDFELTIDDLTHRVSVGVMDEVSKEYGLQVLELPELTQ